jgi:maltose operon substrate-binding protein precursor MalM
MARKFRAPTQFRRVSLSLLYVSLLTASPRIYVGAQAPSQPGARAAQSPSDIAGLLLAQHQVVTFPAQKKKVKRTIEKSEPTFVLSSGESRAFLFELPAATGLYTLKISSVCNCDGPAKSIFVPNAAVLDAKLGLTHTVEEEGFAFKSQSFEAAIDLDATNSADRYVFIYTRGDKVGTQLGALREFGGLLVKLNFPFFRAGHGTIEIEASTRKDK